MDEYTPDPRINQPRPRCPQCGSRYPMPVLKGGRPHGYRCTACRITIDDLPAGDVPPAVVQPSPVDAPGTEQELVMATTKTKAAKKARTPKAAKPDAAANRDQFGSRLGTNTAKFNAALTGTAKSMKVLMDEAGLKDTFYNHANALVKKGFVVSTDDGYKLAT